MKRVELGVRVWVYNKNPLFWILFELTLLKAKLDAVLYCHQPCAQKCVEVFLKEMRTVLETIYRGLFIAVAV